MPARLKPTPRQLRSAQPPVHVALLRGINVGGMNILPMRDLAAMFATAGCSDVQTYIQSGNVVFRAATPLEDVFPQSLARRSGSDSDSSRRS